MKPLFSILLLFLLLSSCKNDKKENPVEPVAELSTAQKIAKAHGIDQWKKVSKIEFTFNTSRGARSWSWEPRTQNVTLISKGDTISYNRAKIDSTSLDADRAFINDKYWFLAPFQLVWDKGTTISDPIKTTAPISDVEMNKITLIYPSEGGYTPGDAYDFYFGDDFIIKEWTFRRGNAEEPSLITTWEDYQDFQGLKLSKMHKNDADDWKLFFTGIKVTLE